MKKIKTILKKNVKNWDISKKLKPPIKIFKK